MLPGVVAVLVFSHSRGVVSHFWGDNGQQQQQLSRRASAEFGWGTFPGAKPP
jgi:hypothetical protein